MGPEGKFASGDGQVMTCAGGVLWGCALAACVVWVPVWQKNTYHVLSNERNELAQFIDTTLRGGQPPAGTWPGPAEQPAPAPSSCPRRGRATWL